MEKELFLTYYKQGLSDTQISKIVNIERHKIGNIRKSLNLPRMNLVIFHREKFLKLHSEGKSYKKISKNLNISPSMAWYIAKN